MYGESFFRTPGILPSRGRGQLYLSHDKRKILGYDSYGDPIYEKGHTKPEYKLTPTDTKQKKPKEGTEGAAGQRPFIPEEKKKNKIGRPKTPEKPSWPKIWNVNGTVQEFSPSKKTTDVEHFDVYVNSHNHFPSNFPKLNIKNVQRNFLTLDNPYYVVCCAAYLSTYLCGISYEQFEDDASPLISCISRYHLYYHLQRFLRSPEKLKTHMTDKHFEFVQKHIPVEYKWEWKFEQTREVYWLFLKKLKDRHIVIKKWYSTKSKYGGQIGFHYLQRGERTIKSLHDYQLFIAQKSNGLTALGQLLFQQSIESFVYSILGSQAQTRWAIVDEGAKSLQTQVVFRKIVNDTVIEDDETITIGDMRKAIKDTHVVLNTAITPGIILIPGSLIILKKKIAGFNNILTLGQSWMQFGENPTVNKVVVPPVKKPIKKENVPSNTNHTPPRHNPVSPPRPKRPSLRQSSPKTPVKSVGQEQQKGNLTTGTGDNTAELMTLFGASTAAGFVGLKLMAMVV